MVTALIMLVTTILMAGCGGKSFDINQYIDTCWTQENTDWSKKGYILHVYQEGDKVLFNLSYLRGEPNPKHTNTIAVKKLSEITSNKIDLYFTNDSWGKSGDIKLVFNGDKIEYTISNVKGGEDANWGFINDKGTLVKNMNAESELQMHNNNNAKPAEPVQTSTKDTSSRILASIGMTEAQFKNSCGRIAYGQGNEPTFVATYHDLFHNPNKYVNAYCYADSLEVQEKSTSTDGYPMYILDYIGSYKFLVFDMRDDPYSPNIVVRDRIKPYMIFKGVRQMGGTELITFFLIAVGK